MSLTQPNLRDSGTYLFASAVDDTSSRDLVDWILTMNLRASLPVAEDAKTQKPDHLTIIVNSPGGRCPDGFAIIDAMNGSKLPIHTVGLGMIASMGLLIFINGKKGHRTLTPNTSILSHQFSWVQWGKQHELLAGSQEQDHLDERIMRHYRRCTGLPPGKIRKELLPPSDRWLTAAEARRLGLCDVVKDMAE